MGYGEDWPDVKECLSCNHYDEVEPGGYTGGLCEIAMERDDFDNVFKQADETCDEWEEIP